MKQDQTHVLRSQQKCQKAWKLMIGCRGFPWQILWGALEVLNIKRTARKNLAANIST